MIWNPFIFYYKHNSFRDKAKRSGQPFVRYKNTTTGHMSQFLVKHFPISKVSKCWKTFGQPRDRKTWRTRFARGKLTPRGKTLKTGPERIDLHFLLSTDSKKKGGRSNHRRIKQHYPCSCRGSESGILNCNLWPRRLIDIIFVDVFPASRISHVLFWHWGKWAWKMLV